MTAHVDGVVVGHEFNVDFMFHPGQANRFISDITQTFWADLKAAVPTIV